MWLGALRAHGQPDSWPTVVVNNELLCEDDSCFIPLLPPLCKGPAIPHRVFFLADSLLAPISRCSVHGHPQAQVLPSDRHLLGLLTAANAPRAMCANDAGQRNRPGPGRPICMHPHVAAAAASKAVPYFFTHLNIHGITCMTRSRSVRLQDFHAHTASK